MRQPQPVAICTVCHHYSYHAGDITQRCSQQSLNYEKQLVRCDGVFESMMGEDDWKECVTCKGVGPENCPECLGAGWISNRK